ncbi:MAG: sigma 54-interacting transcriptional regulator [Polyangiaceae bacterium]
MDASDGPTLTAIRSDSLRVPSLRVAVATDRMQVEAPLSVSPLLVGTSADCDLVVRDGSVSRRHCQLTLTERGVVLKDLDSKNGTFVREVPIREAILHPGVPATIGSCRLLVAVVGEPTVVPMSKLPHFGEALGASLAMRALFARLERAAATEATIVLLGESGTGKELLARAIHAHSGRRTGPFEVLDCAAIAPTLVEAELFGHVRGAFTGAASSRAGLLEQAHGGTLFLDELGEMPLELQPKLLRALESRQIRRVGASDWRSFDARIIAATHRDLRTQVASGTFREDLFYRLAMVEALIPPLRDRKEDIPLLVERFLAEHLPPRTLGDLPPNAVALLMGHDWPGNVRELRNTIARLLLFPEVGGEAIERSGSWAAPEPLPPGLPLREARGLVVAQFERAYIASAMRKHGGKVARAAEVLGISRQLLYRMLDQHGLRREDP